MIAWFVVIKYMIVLVPLCALFMGMRLSRTELFEFDSRWMLQCVSFLWPVFEGQYQAIAARDGIPEANKYALFGFLIFASVPILFIYTAVHFRNLCKRFEFPNIGRWIDYWSIAILGLGGVDLALFDRIARTPFQSGFYPDQNGFFFFRQGFVLFMPVFGALILFVILIHMLSNRTQH